MNGQEIGRIVELVDQFQFVIDLRADLWRYAAGIARFRTLPGEAFQFRLRRSAGRGLVVGIFVAQFVERKTAAVGDDHGLQNRFRVAAEQPRHFFRRLEMTLGIGRQAEPCLVDGAVFADAGQDIHKWLAFRHMHPHVVGGNHRDVHIDREPGEGPQPGAIVAVIAAPCGQPDIASQYFPQTAQMRRIGGIRFRSHAGWRQRDENLAARMGEDVFQPDFAFALCGAAAAERDQRRQPSIGGAVRREAQHRRRVLQVQPGADDKLYTSLFRRLVSAHDTSQRIPVCHRDGR